MIHAVSATFQRFEHMSPPAAGMALVLHVLVAAFLIWAPTHHQDEPDDPIEVTMEAPPPPPEPKPEVEAPKPKPPPPAAASKPAPALDRLGLPPAGPVGPKSTAPPMERGLPTYEPPSQKADQPTPKDEPAQKQEPPQQATAQPAEPSPPLPPPPTLEKELPPVETPPAPLTSLDIPRLSPPVPERKPEPPPQPQQRAQPPRPASPPSPQLQPSPLSRLPRNAPSQQRQTEPPRSPFVNPADAYAQNTILEAYLQRVVYQVSRYRFDGTGLLPTDSVVARFTIARNGSLLAVSIIRSSGKPSLDRDAVTAFQQTAPFPPLPGEVSGDSQTFSLTFFPGRRP